MQIIIFSSNLNLTNEWIDRHNILGATSCYDLVTLNEELNKYEEYVLICDYDSIAHDLNTLISANKLPKKCIVLEKSPAVIIGKRLIYKGVKAYGNSRMLTQHYNQMLQTVKDNDTWTYPELTSALVESTNNINLNDNAKKLLKDRLTDKERKVAYLILEGLSNDAIAQKFNITTRTVKAHITSLFNKLHVNDRISLVLLLK